MQIMGKYWNVVRYFILWIESTYLLNSMLNYGYTILTSEIKKTY